jgi:hypothetical protein
VFFSSMEKSISFQFDEKIILFLGRNSLQWWHHYKHIHNISFCVIEKQKNILEKNTNKNILSVRLNWRQNIVGFKYSRIHFLST